MTVLSKKLLSHMLSFKSKRLIKASIANPLCERLVISLIRKYPDIKSLERIIPLCIDYPTGSLRICERNSHNFELDLSDYQDWLIYYNRKDDSSDFVTNYASPGFFCFDIGANVGQTTLLLASAVGPKGKVYSFEPINKTYKKLVTNIFANKQYGNISTFQVAVGSTDSYAVAKNDSKTSSGSATCAPQQPGSVVDDSVVVPMLTLDTFVAENSVPRVDLVKIDVEGYEPSVLEGARKTIERFRPKIVLEISYELLIRAGYTVKDITSYFDSYNYRLVSVQDEKTFRALDYTGHGDFVACPLP